MFKIDNFRNTKAFTIIELLIVISLVAILSSAGLYTYSAAQKRSRDARRMSDLSQYRTALESFANNHDGLYPARANAVNTTVLCGDLGLAASACPADPTNTGNYIYNYRSDGAVTTGVASATEYILYGYQEAVSTNNFWGLCSSGSTITKATAPTVADCP